MVENFHESLVAGEVKLPSERSTGLVFAAVALIVAISWRNHPSVLFSALAISVALALISFLAPHLLRPLNILWFKIGLLLHRVVSPLVMFLIFAVVFVPAGAILRLWHDPLQLRRRSDVASYWIKREPPSDAAASSMRNQF